MVRRMPRQRLALAVLLAASFTLAVDFSILNVALPAIGADVGLGLSHLQWIATSFALCAAGFTLLFGRIADLFGRRRLFLAGMALLGVSSLVGGLADSPALLLAARAGQGLATAAVTPAALSLLTTSFAEGPLRERALGPQRRADGRRLHHRRRARRAADRRAELALGVLRQRRRRRRGARGRAAGARREPAARAGRGSTCPAPLLVTLALLALVYGTVGGAGSALARRGGACCSRSSSPSRRGVAEPLVPLASCAAGRVAVGQPRRRCWRSPPRPSARVRCSRSTCRTCSATRALATGAVVRRARRGHRARRDARAARDRARRRAPGARRRLRRAGRGDAAAGRARRPTARWIVAAAGGDVRRRRGQPGRDRRLHGPRHLGPARTASRAWPPA